MAITSYQVQNILRTYAKQLSRGHRLAQARRQRENLPSDQVNISIEARRKQVIEKITSEIVANVGSRLPGLAKGISGVEDQALQKLSLEFGKPLDIQFDEATGGMKFRVVNREDGEVVEQLDDSSSFQLQERLYQLTQEIIDQNMA